MMFASLLIPIEAMDDLDAVPANERGLFTRALRGVELVSSGKSPDQQTRKDMIKALAIAYAWIDEGQRAPGKMRQVMRELLDYIVAKQEPDIRTIAALDAELKPETVDEMRWSYHVATVRRARYILRDYEHRRRRRRPKGMQRQI